MIPITILKQDGASSLVQWHDGVRTRRGYLPSLIVGAGFELPESTLETAIPYGIDWASHIEVNITAETIEAELHRRGLWTADDVLNKPDAVQGAIRALVGVNAALVFKTARGIKKSFKET